MSDNSVKKEEILWQVQILAAKGLASKEEVLSAYETGANTGADDAVTHPLGISHILYYIGGAIVFLGIVVLISQRWSTLSDLTKILVTLGSGIAAYITGVILNSQERLEKVSVAFHFIAALVLPLGLSVTFDLAGFEVGTPGLQSFISAILVATYLLSFWVYRTTLFVFFSVVWGTWLFFSLTDYLVGGRPNYDWEFIAYRVLFTGLSYGVLGYYFSTIRYRALTGFLLGFGVMYFLGAALVLGDWKPHQNVLWELLFPGLVFGVLFLSVYLRSKSFLTFGSIYLVAYISKITIEYFENSLGWPLSLVLIGLGLIAIGYLHLYLKKKYLS